ncbi:tyrosine-type recombinase/integrase [Modestobacter marinus]|uniref:tyrosine-type recombinase/integrase n=1 Tax=Modestobacter marinus TaxID=477641 RepID=UPI001C96B17B|nr:site-specific integrase [Modestobacter marinus]
MTVDKAGRVFEFTSVRYLHPEDQAFAEMLSGWRNQQLSRNLKHETIEQRERVVQRFHEHTNEYPWRWHPAHVDEFFGDLRSEKHAKVATVRSYQAALRAFCAYISSPDYGWNPLCERLFGTHPAQICFDWNTAAHVQEADSQPAKRAFTRRELQDFFDRADDEVARITSARRKGWLPAYRDAVLFKVAYVWGLRRNEVRHVQTVDFSRNPHAREFGRYGVLAVRYGKAMRGSPPKRRSVLTVFDWSAEVVEDWLDRGHRHMTQGLDLFTTERGTLVSGATLLRRFRSYCDDLNLSPGLDFHSLRRSYVTHLIEAGMDALFVQHQVGHEHASTTALYASVSSDYRTRTLRHALDSTLSTALNGNERESS